MGKNSFVAGLMLCVISAGCLAVYFLAVYVYDCNGTGSHQICMIPSYVFIILLIGFLVPGLICIASNRGHFRDILRQAREDRERMREKERIKREKRERYMKWLRPFWYILIGLFFASLILLLFLAINYEILAEGPEIIVAILLGGTIVISIIFWALEKAWS